MNKRDQTKEMPGLVGEARAFVTAGSETTDQSGPSRLGTVFPAAPTENLGENPARRVFDLMYKSGGRVSRPPYL
jgi:hypothetical protein